MTAPFAAPSGAAAAGLVIALHCSGGSGRQWRKLNERLDPHQLFLAPDLIGASGAAGWDGAKPFHLADEAAPIIAAIDAHAAPIHLVGHSYGGGLALHLATRRPHRLASLTLYEPSAFHLLKTMGAKAQPALQEIAALAESVRQALATGTYRAACRRFVDYWNGDGTWAGMRPELQSELLRYLPKIGLEFHALLEEPTLLQDLGLHFPVLILHGEHAPLPTRMIAALLAARLPVAERVAVEGAGHMGPLTHGDQVAEQIARRIQARAADGVT